MGYDNDRQVQIFEPVLDIRNRYLQLLRFGAERSADAGLIVKFSQRNARDCW
jgi:hypothetical protein